MNKNKARAAAKSRVIKKEVTRVKKNKKTVYKPEVKRTKHIDAIDLKDPQVALLELLKLRLGAASLQQCEVMVKDVEEAKVCYLFDD